MPGSEHEGDGVQAFTRSMKLSQEWFGTQIDPSHPYIRNFQCPRCHRKFRRSSANPFDHSTYWQNCSRECLLGEEPKVILKVTGPGTVPNRAYYDDCGMDLFTYCPETHINGTHRSCYRVNANQFIDIDCGIEIQLPEGIWGLITGRSSAIRKKGLLIPNGVIDTGYRGRLYMPVQNMTKFEQFIDHGDRIGQLILMQNVSLGVTIERVEALDLSERGEKGRGSTGK